MPGFIHAHFFTTGRSRKIESDKTLPEKAQRRSPGVGAKSFSRSAKKTLYFNPKGIEPEYDVLRAPCAEEEKGHPISCTQEKGSE